MPTQVHLPQPQEKSLSETPLKLSSDIVGDLTALAMVNETFRHYENFRFTNHDRRWNTHDGLYWGFVKPRNWQGTKIARASLPNPIAFDHIQTALPLITQAIFGFGSEWFQVWPEGGATTQDALAIQEHMRYNMQHARYDNGSSAEIELHQAFQSMLQYGNGYIHLQWDELRNRATIEWLDIRDLYVDPGCKSPNIDDCRSVLVRRMYTVDQLAAMRGLPGVNVPSNDALYTMALSAPSAPADSTKQVSESLRGVQYTPASDNQLPMPSDKYVEVLIFYSQARIIWALNRKHIMIRRPNRYGFIPICGAPCYPVLGRHYAEGMCDKLEGPQRFGEALMNCELDRLALEIIPPRVQPSSQIYGASSQDQYYPGAVLYSGADGETRLLTPEGNRTNIHESLQAIDMMAQRRTGVNSMSQGAPAPGNINRTRAGVNALMQGPALRVQPIVKGIEEYCLTPLLYKLYLMIRANSREGEGLPVTSGQGMVSSEAFKAPVRFRMMASSKMLSQEKLASMFPFLIQYLMNGSFLQGLGKAGMAVDFPEIIRMLQDATGTGQAYNVIRKITPEEKQQMQQPPPDVMAKMQMQQKSDETRLKMGEMKAKTEMSKIQGLTAISRSKEDEVSAREFMKAILKGGQGGGR